jgi:hypothetical protein
MPHHYFASSAEERAESKLTDDLCMTGDGFFFVRAVMETPILGEKTPLEWGVWGSLSEANFKRYVETFDDHDQGSLGGMFSYLNNELDGYSGSCGLQCELIPMDNRKRPMLVPYKDQDHLLVRDYWNGITAERAIALAMPFLHPTGKA